MRWLLSGNLSENFLHDSTRYCKRESLCMGACEREHFLIFWMRPVELEDLIGRSDLFRLIFAKDG